VLALVGTVASIINTMAGGGGLLVLPVLTEGFLLSPSHANGTMRVGVIVQNTTSVIAFARRREGDRKVVLTLLPAMIAGCVVGTLLATRLADKPQLIAFPSPDVLSGVLTFGAITIPKVNVASFVVGLVLLGLLTVFVTRTNLGLSMRATAEDVAAARLVGINVNRVVATAFAIGSALAAVAGLLYSVQAGQINPYMGFTPVLKAFIAAVIGGFGSISGAVVGGFVLGFLEVLVTALSGIGDLLPPGSVPPEVRAFLQDWLPAGLASWRDAIVFVVLIVVLLVRPQGILGRRDRTDEG
jgi:branched-subunit amino acid ABC-type transport system permease component